MPSTQPTISQGLPSLSSSCRDGGGSDSLLIRTKSSTPFKSGAGSTRYATASRSLFRNDLKSEKLDGTNVGIRCDGRVFGRRQEVVDTSYQKVQPFSNVKRSSRSKTSLPSPLEWRPPTFPCFSCMGNSCAIQANMDTKNESILGKKWAGLEPSLRNTKARLSRTKWPRKCSCATSCRTQDS
jgi:hypothetical protein